MEILTSPVHGGQLDAKATALRSTDTRSSIAASAQGISPTSSRLEMCKEVLAAQAHKSMMNCTWLEAIVYVSERRTMEPLEPREVESAP